MEEMLIELPAASEAVFLRNDGLVLAEASRLFERVRYLEHAEVLVVAADDLHSNRKSFRREASRH
jgi:hypothetical protein